MEEQCSPLSWSCYYQQEVEELKHSLVYSTLELEAAIVSAHEEISRKDDEIVQLKGLVAKFVQERDEFHANYEQLMLEKCLLLQDVHVPTKQHPECPVSSHTTSNQEDVDTDESNTAGAAPPPCCKDVDTPIISMKKPLPERGKFLQAVMQAGPLLNTLLLAGALPRWQHPPPQLSSGDIPPVKISSPAAPPTIGNNKRGMEGQDSSPNPKHQKVCSPTNPPTPLN